MTIPTSGAVSFSAMATEYGLNQNKVSLRNLSSIGGIAYTQVSNFRGKNYWDRVGSGTPTNTFSGTGSSGTDISGTQAVIRSVLDMDDTTSNIIYETGGSGRGVCVYVYNGTLYAQAGNGSVAGGDTEVSFPIPANWTDDYSREVLVCLDVTDSISTLWVDGIRRSTDVSTSNASVAGVDAGGTGRAYSSVCATRAFAKDPGDGTYVLTNATQYGSQVWNGTYISSESWPIGLYGVTSDLIAGSTSSPLINATQMTVRSIITLDNTKNGIIYETGGTGRGSVFYVFGGKLYGSGGRGDSSGPTFEVSWDIPDSITDSVPTQVLFTAIISSTSSKGALYVNNELVATVTGGGHSPTELSGGNEGGTGDGYGGSVAKNRMSSYTYTGTIYETLLFNTSNLTL
jgi:hypothetical protein